MKIGIAGAGLAGRLAAFQLSQYGHDLTVFESGPSAAPALGTLRAAAWTAAGMLSPVAEMESGGPVVRDLGYRSIELWKAISAQAGRAAHDIGLVLGNSTMVCHAQDIGMAQRVLRLLGNDRTPLTPMTADDLRQVAPGIKGTLHAWQLAGEGHLHPTPTMHFLMQAAQQTQWLFDQTVTQIAPGTIQAGGRQHAFDWVIDSRGLGAARDIAVRGVRGEIIQLHAPGFQLKTALRLLHPRWRVYIVPRPDEQVVVGATEIESEDRSPISVQSTLELLSASFSIFPELAEARILSTDVNLRPAMPDNLPLIETQQGLTRVNGLFRHGWLLAPAVIERALRATPLVS